MAGEKPPLPPWLRSLAERYRSGMGPHPPVEELIAYLAGELPHEQQERLRDHLALCHDCASLLRDLADFPDLAPPEGARPLSAQEVEGAWEEMEKRLGRAGKPESPPSGPPAVWTGPAGAASKTLRQRWIRALASLAAVLFLATVAVSFWALSLQRKLSQPRTDLGIVSVNAWEEERGPGTDEEIELPGDRANVIAVSPEPTVTYPEHELEILKMEGESKVLWRGQVTERDETGAFLLEIPKGFLPPGPHQLRLYGIENGRREVIVDRRLRVL